MYPKFTGFRTLWQFFLKTMAPINLKFWTAIVRIITYRITKPVFRKKLIAKYNTYIDCFWLNLHRKIYKIYSVTNFFWDTFSEKSLCGSIVIVINIYNFKTARGFTKLFFRKILIKIGNIWGTLALNKQSELFNRSWYFNKAWHRFKG